MEEALQEKLLALLENVIQHPEHHLSPKDRIDLFKFFGPSNHAELLRDAFEQTKAGTLKFSQADLMLGWLAILTAEKVLPVWEEMRSQPEGNDWETRWGNPKTTIEMCKNLLGGQNLFQEGILRLRGLFYYRTPDYDEEASIDTFKFYFSSRVATDALELVLLGTGALIGTGALLYTDDARSFQHHDFAAMAVTAYAGYEQNNAREKRLEFWQWWLTEAVPHSWELAETFY